MTHPSGDLLAATDNVNQAQRDQWNEDQPRYDQRADRWEEVWAPFGQAMFEAARLQPGEQVLDVGCGYGTTTIEAARRVQPGGHVVGIDIAEAMLGPARRRVLAADLDNIELVEADAQVHAFEVESFDAVISRFGTMFFEDPEAAFANLASALRPGGRLAFVCWQDPLKSEWIATAVGAAVAALGQPPNLGDPGAPGPFAFADGERLQRLLTAGGFRDVTVESVTRPQRIGDDADDAAAFLMSIAEDMQVFAGAPDHVVEAARDALRASYAPYAEPHGVVLNGTAWLVGAHS
jgi:SAM-dependent methyltransferase